MKLNGMQSQEIKSVLTPETELLQNAKTHSSETSTIDTDAGSASKLGEFNNQSSQIKQNLFAKLQTGTPASGFGTEATVTKIGDKVIIDAGAGNDKIGITQNRKTGDITVSVNGKTQTFSGKDKDNLVIKAGDGNDTIKVVKGVTVKLQLEGGNGNDTIAVDKNVKSNQTIYGNDGNDTITGGAGDDKIEAGAGDDTVDGGAGRDYIDGSTGRDTLKGGAGNDVIYGGDGNDTIDGGTGNDYLEGSKDDDTISGGTGNDILSGGLGNDTLKGGLGNDVLYAGAGKDKLTGGLGSNKIYSQKGDTVDKNGKGVKNTVVTVELKGNPGGTSVVINGSDEFKEKVGADLEMMRSSPVGKEMLTAFDTSGKTVTISEEANNAGATWIGRGNSAVPTPFIDSKTGTKGTPQDGRVMYDHSLITLGTRDWEQLPPSLVLFHELAHNNDYTHGTLRDGQYNGTDVADNGVNNRERVATGLPIDHDGDPKTPEQLDPEHPSNLTENALRKEMNLPRRTTYQLEFFKDSVQHQTSRCLYARI